MKLLLWMPIGVMMVVVCSGCKGGGVSSDRVEGDVLLVEIRAFHKDHGVVAERSNLDAAGLDLGEWSYTKIDEKAFMIWKSIGIKKNLKYRSDTPGKFGTCWSVEDDNGSREWLP